MTWIFAAAAGTGFLFHGGGPGLLVDAIQKSDHEPCVIFADREVLPKITFSYDTRADRNQRLARRLGLKDRSKSQLAFGPLSLPDFLMTASAGRFLRLQKYEQTFVDKTVEMVRVVDGKVTVAPAKPEGYIRVGSLGRVPFAKPLRVHWLLKSLRFSAGAEGVDEQKFLGLVARAGIGNLTASETEMSIDLDPAEFRRLFVNYALEQAATCEDRARFQRRDELRYRISANIVQSATDEQIRKLMASPEGSAMFSVTPASAAAGFVAAYVREWISPSPWGGECIEDRSILDLIDFSKPARVQLTAQGGCLIMMSGKKPRSLVGL